MHAFARLLSALQLIFTAVLEVVRGTQKTREACGPLLKKTLCLLVAEYELLCLGQEERGKGLVGRVLGFSNEHILQHIGGPPGRKRLKKFDVCFQGLFQMFLAGYWAEEAQYLKVYVLGLSGVSGVCRQAALDAEVREREDCAAVSCIDFILAQPQAFLA